MTVRWKPLIILSGLFLVVAIGGLMAFAFAMGSGSAEEMLAQARAAREADKFENAEVYYKQALQARPTDAAIHEELAGLYREWPATLAPDRRREREGERLRHLLDAAKYDKAALEPRKALLAEALLGSDQGEQLHWARQVVALDGDDVDARYVVAAVALAEEPANVSEARVNLDRLQELAPDRDRTAWIAARLAVETRDDATLKTVLDDADAAGASADGDPIDRICRLNLLALALEHRPADAGVDPLVGAIRAQVAGLIERVEDSRSRIVELAAVSQRTRAALVRIDAARADGRWSPIAEAVDAGFARVTADDGAGLWIYRAYAEHLNLQEQYARSLDVVTKALDSPAAKGAGVADEVSRLRQAAVKAALADTSDDRRYVKAEPHIEALIASTNEYQSGLGHLFQGAIDLERSGLIGAAGRPIGGADVTSKQTLTEARDHLKEAVTKLPHLATARALYGIALTLCNEPSLGRQYLVDANRIADLEPRYRVWAAWSLLQAGYPEEARPIVSGMLALIDRGQAPAELSPTLKLLEGEIARSRRSPQDLALARAAYAEAGADGSVAPSVALRLAELTIATEGPEPGLAQLDAIRKEGKGGPEAEHLAVATLVGLGRDAESRAALDEARRRYPDSARSPCSTPRSWSARRSPPRPTPCSPPSWRRTPTTRRSSRSGPRC